MVLQLCGRVCRRLSFKNPHHLFDEDFFCFKMISLKNLLKKTQAVLGIQEISFLRLLKSPGKPILKLICKRFSKEYNTEGNSKNKFLCNFL